MLKNRIIRLAIVPVLILSLRLVRAQSEPVSGWYEIIAGSYSECCGFAGNEFRYDLPNETQEFVRFTVDAQNLATMTFLAQDMKTVFSTTACTPLGAINFSFNHGFI